MAEKFKIDIFRLKTADEFIKLLSDPESRLETGSAAAVAAGEASALLMRAAAIASAAEPEDERLQYILKNAGILRDYMINLIDEDVKARAPLNRALRGGDAREIEASRHPATAICAEIISMMCRCIELLTELTERCPKEALHYLGSAAELAAGAMKSARMYVVNMADKCSDDTYRYITRRENELTFEQYLPMAQSVADKVYSQI